MAERPEEGSDWLLVNINSFTKEPEIGSWESLGFSLAGDWQSARESPERSFRGLLMAVEGENSVLSLECSIDLSSTTRNKIECHWFEEIFLGAQPNNLFSPPPKTKWEKKEIPESYKLVLYSNHVATLLCNR